MQSSEISRLRKKIDALDAQIAGLLQKRASLAQRIGREKKRLGIPLKDGKREKQVLARVGKRRGALPAKSMQSIYRQVIRACSGVEGK